MELLHGATISFHLYIAILQETASCLSHLTNVVEFNLKYFFLKYTSMEYTMRIEPMTRSNLIV